MQQASRRCCWLRVTRDGGKSLRKAAKSCQTTTKTGRHGAGGRCGRLAVVLEHFVNERGRFGAKYVWARSRQWRPASHS